MTTTTNIELGFKNELTDTRCILLGTAYKYPHSKAMSRATLLKHCAVDMPTCCGHRAEPGLVSIVSQLDRGPYSPRV